MKSKERPKVDIADFVDEFRPECYEGYLNSNLPWFSPKDLEATFGKSRQYWCKLIKQGKLKAHATACSPIVTTEGIIEYFDAYGKRVHALNK